MNHIPDYTNVSLALSEVLAELGVNDVIVNKRRRISLMTETISTIRLKMRGNINRVFMFGSMSEGTTTRGLKSDIDYVFCANRNHVIPEWRDWKHGALNLMMVDEDTPPGYCMLQLLRRDVPLPETEIPNENYLRDRHGRIIRKINKYLQAICKGQEQHGPAISYQGRTGIYAWDVVPAFPCQSQLPVVQHWISHLHRLWPSDDMKRYIVRSPSFVVPVGSKRSANVELEWRISTSLAERCLMFNLNITQLQVYALLKMLLKTSINYNVPEESHISSFMCKNVLLHCVQNTVHNVWKSHMLIQCLLFSLFRLFVCVVNENCPHFIIRSNNLMSGRLTQKTKYQLFENFQWLFDDILSRGVLSLNIDDIARRLIRKLNPLMHGIGRHANDLECQFVCADLLFNYALDPLSISRMVLLELTENKHKGIIFLLQCHVQSLMHIYRDGNTIVRSACRLITPYVCTILGSVLASKSLQRSNIISQQSLTFFSLGIVSDVSSSKLKLASISSVQEIWRGLK